ncbi:hypothetical protein H0H92_000545 [Tricholoma furcatifolium]|nr:hypothetical protein H0H92_000545 [Tricholoma furcatifolium]
MSQSPPAPPDASPSPSQDVDPQILEALRSKDRIYVLKLGELMEGLIHDRRERIELTPSTSYQRLLVHRCSAYYKLLPESDPSTKGIFVSYTPEGRIPQRRLCDLVPPEATTAPAFKIMRRSPPDRRPNRSQSQVGSVAGDEPDSDPEPSESGSQGGRSNATGRSNKSRMTIEEREAAYNEARSRIFMDFEEKEKGKDPNASSSSLSISGSTSAGGGSSASGDQDDLVSSPTTESEFSVPTGRERKDSRHLGRHHSASSSSRSLRSGPSYSGPGSSRNSRAPSPSFTYANIYEPNQTTYYDPSMHPSGYGPSPYMYPYPPPGMPPNAYYGGYPYYPYQYQSPPPQHSSSDPSTPASAEPYMSSPNGAYPQAYGWPMPPHMMIQSPPMPPPHMPPPPPPHAGAPPPPGHNPYAPSPGYYPAPGYYPMPPMESPPGHVNQHSYDVPRTLNGGPQANSGRHSNNGSPGTNGRTSARHNSLTGPKGRGAPPIQQGRSPWSYGPGVGQGGQVNHATETIGPRLSNRRTSNNSVTSTASRSSICDEVASTASSSTTSSSSRRTYTSTTSSQHPLPARPDWAVGLKPQPTLHATQSRHHDHSHSNSRTMSPISAPRNLNGNGHHHPNHTQNNSNSDSEPQQQQPVPLQSPTEFPPLSSAGGVAPEKRAPVVSGAWGNTSTTRNIRVMSPAQQAAPNALVQHSPMNNGTRPAPQAGVDAADESDHTFERPPPKSAELFNPKLLKRPAQGKPAAQTPAPAQLQLPQEKDNQKENLRDGDALVEQVEALTLADGATAASGAGVESQAQEGLTV